MRLPAGSVRAVVLLYGVADAAPGVGVLFGAQAVEGLRAGGVAVRIGGLVIRSAWVVQAGRALTAVLGLGLSVC